MVSERDFVANQNDPFSPYRPYITPSAMAPVNVESPATTFPEQVLVWTSPDDMLDSSIAGRNDMFTKDGPAPATTARLPNTLTDLETFDGSRRYFGSVMANCEAALSFAVPYLNGAPYPADTMLPDYNLDSDRGYAWPCWDVDWSYNNPMAPFPWNGCDPFPADTLNRVQSNPPSNINWGSDTPDPTQNPPGLRPGLTVNDPWGSPRSGDAWVNAVALGTPGDCQYGMFPFPAIVIDPNRDDPANLDQCNETVTATDTPGGGLLGPDYHFAPAVFLYSDRNDPKAPHVDLPSVYLHFPYTGSTTTENDGWLADFLRAVSGAVDPQLILANAVSLWLGGGTTPLAWGDGTIASPSPIPASHDLATAVAQLAVTGRKAFDAFARWTPQRSDLIAAFNNAFPSALFTPGLVQDATEKILDAAYTALRAIRSNDPAWRQVRTTMRWLAVSGFDDTPHRPVNVPTAPYPQYDLNFSVPLQSGGTLPVTTRFMIASAHTFVGPNDGSTSFTAPDPELLLAPSGPSPGGRAPWGSHRMLLPYRRGIKSSSMSTAVDPALKKRSIWPTGLLSRATLLVRVTPSCLSTCRTAPTDARLT